MTAVLSRWREILVGTALAVAAYASALLLPASWRLILEGSLVAWIGAIYVGFGLASGTRPAIIEVAGGMLMLVLAVLGSSWNPWLLTAALVLHAGWDLAHHDGRISPAVPRWYPSFCAAADLVLAGLFGATRG